MIPELRALPTRPAAIEERRVTQDDVGRSLPYDTRVLWRLERYWRRMPAAEGVPLRRDLDPAELRDILPSLFMLDVLPGEQGRDRRYRFRLVGTGVCELTGRDMTGRDMDESSYGASYGFVRKLFDAVVERRAPVLFHGSAKWRRASAWKGLAVILLPLSLTGREVDIILGAVNIARVAVDQPPSSQLVALSDATVVLEPTLQSVLPVRDFSV